MIPPMGFDRFFTDAAACQPRYKSTKTMETSCDVNKTSHTDHDPYRFSPGDCRGEPG